MAGHIILTIIIGCFIIFALRYFYFNSLRTAQHRNRSFLAALKCIYWLPVFSQAMIVVYCMIIGFYYFVLTLTSRLIAANTSGDLLKNATHFNYFFVLCSTIFSIAILGWLAGISSNRQLDFKSLTEKVIYIVLAICTSAELRRQLAFCMVGSPVSFGVIWWVFFGLSMLIFGLLSSQIAHRYRLLRYLQLAAKIASGYIFCCIGFALFFYLAWRALTWLY